jgi:hypothetical protein
MEKATKLSTIGLGISLGLAWSIGVLIVGVMALVMEQATVEPFKNLFNIMYPGWGDTLGKTLLMTVWSFTHGFVGGFLIGIFYNLFAKRFN